MEMTKLKRHLENIWSFFVVMPIWVMTRFCNCVSVHLMVDFKTYNQDVTEVQMWGFSVKKGSTAFLLVSLVYKMLKRQFNSL